ncbi:MAG: catalase family protein [Deltaproteobacteria bacterium]|nr:catalase family protein [Deltaproteobacteria bacterium]
MSFHEVIAAGEDERFETLALRMRDMQRARAKKRGMTLRALHTKQHVGVAGTLEVTAPVELRKGVFSEPKSWPVYARFSNGSGGRQPDSRPDVRGIGIKLVGVEGKKLIPGLEEKRTQDFLFIGNPAIPVRTPDEFLELVDAMKDGPAKALPRLAASLGVVRTLQVLRRVAGTAKITSMATAPFYTAAPISFGDSAAKLGLFPISPAQRPAARGEHALRDDLIARLEAGPLSWSLRAQLFLDDERTPIEDASVVWPEGASPYREVAKLTLPRQDPGTPEGRELSELVESLSFDPWHSLEAHRPLGAIMRARAVAYKHSVLERGAADEPESVRGLPE